MAHDTHVYGRINSISPTGSSRWHRYRARQRREESSCHARNSVPLRCRYKSTVHNSPTAAADRNSSL